MAAWAFQALIANSFQTKNVSRFWITSIKAGLSTGTQLTYTATMRSCLEGIHLRSSDHRERLAYIKIDGLSELPKLEKRYSLPPSLATYAMQRLENTSSATHLNIFTNNAIDL